MSALAKSCRSRHVENTTDAGLMIGDYRQYRTFSPNENGSRRSRFRNYLTWCSGIAMLLLLYKTGEKEPRRSRVPGIGLSDEVSFRR